MHEDLLIKLGLSVREAAIYTTLVKEGELKAGIIAKKTGLIRTNVYDVLNSLIKKGIAAYVIRNDKKYFSATEPEKLIDYLESQQGELEDLKIEIRQVLPEFKSLQQSTERPAIEVYEGREGMKTILAMSVRESLKTKKEIVGISVQQEKCRLLAGPYHIRWYNDRAKYKIKSRYLMSAEEKVLPVKYTEFKMLPKEAKNPNEIFIFGNTTCHFYFTGELFTAIVIKNQEITQKYRDYFNFLWNILD